MIRLEMKIPFGLVGEAPLRAPDQDRQHFSGTPGRRPPMRIPGQVLGLQLWPQLGGSENWE